MAKMEIKMANGLGDSNVYLLSMMKMISLNQLVKKYTIKIK